MRDRHPRSPSSEALARPRAPAQVSRLCVSGPSAPRDTAARRPGADWMDAWVVKPQRR